MWIKTIVICCLVATVLAGDEHRPKIKKDETRGKRNLEYSISHTYPQSNNHRLERRISNTLPQRYPPTFFPGLGQRSYNNYYRKAKPHSLPAPPYAVQMEPLVHYSQRDPLYDSSALHILPPPNDLSKPDDLITDNNHLHENVYGPPKHYIDRPVYIKEPEPIIEIIIKESNTTLPPPEQYIHPIPKKKKEEVQVFYVKYKKNPHGAGKDSIIYDKPIAALSPIQDEHTEEESPQESYGVPNDIPVTYSPIATTTIRAIIKPDSETFHADTGIHVTFGNAHHNPRAEKYSHDDDTVESAPQPAISHPEGRRFPDVHKRQPENSFQNGPQDFKSEQRLPQPYRPFNFNSPPPPARFSQHQTFPRPVSQNPPNFPPPFGQHNGPPPQNHGFPPRNNQHFGPPPQNFNHQSRPPPFQQFEQRPPQQQFNFPRQQTHFPIQQQLPLNNQPPPFNQQRQNLPPPQSHQFQNIQNQHQQISQHQQHQQIPQQQQIHNAPQLQHNQPQQIHHQPQLHQQQSQPIHQIQHQSQQQQSLVHTEQNHPIISNQNHLISNHQNRPIQNNQFEQFNNQNFQQTPQFQQVKSTEQFQFNQQAQNIQTNNFRQQQFNLNNLQQQHQHIIPPGGELIQALPKFEQHISVPAISQEQNQQHDQMNQQQTSQDHLNQQQISQDHLNQQQYNQQIQQQFRNSQNVHQQQDFQQHQQTPQALPLIQNQATSSSYQHFTQGTNTPQISTTRQVTYQTTQKPTTYTPTKKIYYQKTTEAPTTTTTTTSESTTPFDLKSLNIQLPDEVPDDLRAQLLSSGILKNAQISVLDYDKVGDIPISALPPDQLANFYSAGGAQQIAAAGSEPKPAIVKLDGRKVDDQEMEGTETDEVKVSPPPVQMKVVHYDPQSQQGQQVHDSYVKEGATQTEPVVLNDQTYNRYLPLKVSGAQFPIPEVPELKGKNINSVVVLAPVDYNFQNARVTRQTKKDESDIKLIKNEALKVLLKNPSADNYRKFLENENRTSTTMQSVILLVTGSETDPKDREIFMYDVATQSVSKLDGELSTAFVDAAESNTSDDIDNNKQSNDLHQLSEAESNIVETKVPLPEGVNIDRRDFNSDLDLDSAASDLIESKVPIIDPMDGDLQAEGSEQLESFVDVSGMQIHPQGDLISSATDDNHVFISSGYSKTDYKMPLH